MEKLTLTYCGQQVKVACDEKCNKAWGINKRPKEQLSGDPDDYVYLSDNELGEAPVNPRTYEGDDAKPIDKSDIPNKWCVRQCERCEMSDVGKWNEPLKLKDFSVRRYNMPDKHRKELLVAKLQKKFKSLGRSVVVVDVEDIGKKMSIEEIEQLKQDKEVVVINVGKNEVLVDDIAEKLNVVETRSRLPEDTMIHLPYILNKGLEDIKYSHLSKKEKSYKLKPVRTDEKIQRNSPCPCGSGKKYKQCCALK